MTKIPANLRDIDKDVFTKLVYANLPMGTKTCDSAKDLKTFSINFWTDYRSKDKYTLRPYGADVLMMMTKNYRIFEFSKNKVITSKVIIDCQKIFKSPYYLNFSKKYLIVFDDSLIVELLIYDDLELFMKNYSK